MTRKSRSTSPPATDSGNAAAAGDSSMASPVEDKAEMATQWATAYHEAGHAVAAIVLGRMVERVTIVPGKTDYGLNTLGRCHLQKGRPSKDRLEDEIVILFAGMVAEARVTGEYCTLGARHDLLAIRRLVNSRIEGERQIERYQNRCLDRTEHLISEEWETVKAVAQELVARQTVSSRGLRHICKC